MNLKEWIMSFFKNLLVKLQNKIANIGEPKPVEAAPIIPPQDQPLLKIEESTTKPQEVKVVSPTSMVYNIPMTNANPTVARSKMEAKPFMIEGDNLTPSEIMFNKLMASGSADAAYKYAFKNYFHSFTRVDGKFTTDAGMGGSGGRFWNKLVELYGDTGAHQIVNQYNKA